MKTKLEETISKALELPIEDSRIPILQQLTDYIKNQVEQKKPVNLNFICTHNSRRSQFSQIWAKTASVYYQVPINSFSGGVEVTAFNERAVASCQRQGFKVVKELEEKNPAYQVRMDKYDQVRCFSKVFDHIDNPQSDFAAIMTCSEADENCPIIPGADVRIPLRYKDPKAFDDTELEVEKYDERNLQIASELLFVFRSVSQQ